MKRCLQMSQCHSHTNRHDEVRETSLPNWACSAQACGCNMTSHIAHFINGVWTMSVWACVFPCKRQLNFFVMRDYNMCRWCYYSHFTLEMKGKAAVVTRVRVAWHILKWPSALSLGMCILSFPRLAPSHCVILWVLSISWTLTQPPVILSFLSFCPSVHIPFLSQNPPQIYPFFHLFFSPCPHPPPWGQLSSPWALIIIAYDWDADSISGILQ